MFGALSCATGGSKKPVRRVMPGDLVIQLMPDTAWLDTRKHYFQMPLNVYNNSRVPVTLGVCGIKAEKLVNGEWQNVFRPNCMGFGPFTIEPNRGMNDLLEVWRPWFRLDFGTRYQDDAGYLQGCRLFWGVRPACGSCSITDLYRCYRRFSQLS